MASGNSDFWETRLGADWSETGVGYRALGKAFNQWMYRLRQDVFLAKIRTSDIDVPASNVFDMGSGTGFYVRLWQELGAESVTGSDLTRAAVQNLAETFPGCDFYQFDATDETLPVPEGSFDVVSAMDMLFHITNDPGHRQAIRNAGRLLKSGGWFVLTENLLHVAEQRGDRQVNRSVHRIESALDDAGFDIVDVSPMFVLMNSQVDASWLRRRAWALVIRTLTLTRPTGWAAGAALYRLDKRLVAAGAGKSGPSTSMLICRKR